MSQRRPYRRGGPRGGYRGINPMNRGGFGGFGYSAPPVRSCYDYTIDQSNLEGTKNTFDAAFEKEILERAANLTPSPDVRNKLETFAKEVIAALEKEKVEKSLPEVPIEQVVLVGSFANDTYIHSSEMCDVVVQLNTLPSSETIIDLGGKVCQLLREVNPKDIVTSKSHQSGFTIDRHSARVNILLTINANDSAKLEPILHLASTDMMINHFAVRHANWFQELKKSMPAEFMQEYQALIRVLKAARGRFTALGAFSIWALQYLAFYCLLNGPSRQKTCLGTAFRRFFEVIAAGMFNPKAATLVDPTSPGVRIGFDLTLQQQDILCMAAQTLVRTFATGNDGYRAVLGTHGTPQDLTQISVSYGGVEVHPSLPVYWEGCMSLDFPRAEAPDAVVADVAPEAVAMEA